MQVAPVEHRSRKIRASESCTSKVRARKNRPGKPALGQINLDERNADHPIPFPDEILHAVEVGPLVPGVFPAVVG